jgi:phosphonate transport system substrate-binding protein
MKLLGNSQVSLTGLFLSFLILGVGVGCNPQPNVPTQGEEINQEKVTETFKIAVIPAVSADEQQVKLDNLLSYLEESLNQSVQVQVSLDYETAVEALVKGEVQMAFLGPFTYVQARDRDPNLEPIVAAINESTGRPWYTSLIVTPTGSGISSLEGLRGQKFAFVSESSTSGFLIPSVQFQEMGLIPEADFATVTYSGGHDKSLGLLQRGEVDAIAIDSEVFQTAKDSGQIQASDYKIIWESDPIPTEPIVISGGLPSPLVMELKKALINAPEGLFDVSGSESVGYTLVEDADYEPIRKIHRRFADQLNKS